MSEPILLATSDDEFQEIVADALRNSRERAWGKLADSPLAQSSFVEGCLGASEANNKKLRGRAVRGMLRWGMNELRPTEEHSWIDKQWHPYNILFYLYMEGMSFDDMARKMGIAKATLYKKRSEKALPELAEILREALQRAQEPQQLKLYTIALRYFLLTESEQQLLRMAIIFRRPFPAPWLHQEAQQAQISNIALKMNKLIKANFLLLNENQDGGAQIAAHPDIRPHLQPMLWAKERQNWHWSAANRYLTQRDYLQAAYHFQRTGDKAGVELAAQTLLDNQQAMIDAGQTKQLGEKLAEFEAHQLAADLWADVKIAAGDVALLLGEGKRAIAEYSLALSAPQIETKALAHYKIGRATKRTNLDEAITHFERGIELLEPLPQAPPLLPDLYLDMVWLYLQDRLSLQKAENNLNKAQAVIRSDDSRRRVNLHNAWAKLCYKRGEQEGEREHALKALVAARETMDSDLIINMAHNVGQAYIWQGEYDQGRAYVEEALELTIQTADKSKEGGCYKTTGFSYFFQAEYDQAIAHYQRAYDIFVEIGNRNWQGDACHDLAEAYAENWQKAQMEQHLQEATEIAAELQDEQLDEDLKELRAKYSSRMKLKARQWQAMNYVNKHGQITTREYQDLIELPKATATRHLRNLCKKGFLVKEGRGRATYYRLRNCD